MTSAARPFELIIFDCDGVLVDSERLSIRVDVAYLERLGWPMDEAEIVERFVGRSDADMRTTIEDHLGGPIPADVDDWFRRVYRETFENELEPVEGIVGVLDAVAAAGIEACVASSGTHEKIRRNLELTGLTPYFDDRVFSAVDVIHGKPAPDLFLHAARTLGVDPGTCAVVEDSVYGVMAAAAAGMDAFGYAGGVTPAERLRGAAPTATIFERMAELPPLLELTTRA